MDSGDKGNNKCVSIALKYALIDMFTIPTIEQKEADPDGQSVEVKLSLSEAETTEIMTHQDIEGLGVACRELLNKKGKNYAKFIKDLYATRKAQLELVEVA
jgi:hypothetical protein